jgi:hypothetical protein
VRRGIFDVTGHLCPVTRKSAGCQLTRPVWSFCHLSWPVPTDDTASTRTIDRSSAAFAGLRRLTDHAGERCGGPTSMTLATPNSLTLKKARPGQRRHSGQRCLSPDSLLAARRGLSDRDAFDGGFRIDDSGRVIEATNERCPERARVTVMLGTGAACDRRFAAVHGQGRLPCEAGPRRAGSGILGNEIQRWTGLRTKCPRQWELSLAGI